jgi:AcrR family transcriptional regulator
MPKAPIPPTRREPLNAQRICDAALAVIERDGLDAFSTRKLGAELGCEAMSLYHHFPSKAHVLDALVDRLLGELPDPPAALSPAQRLRVMALAWRALAHRYPQFAPWLALHRWNSAAGLTLLERLLTCFADGGMNTEQAAKSLRVLGYYVMGAMLDETRGYGSGASAVSPVADEAVGQKFVAVSQAGEYFRPAHFDATFELGLGALLRSFGLEAKAV